MLANDYEQYRVKHVKAAHECKEKEKLIQKIDGLCLSIKVADSPPNKQLKHRHRRIREVLQVIYSISEADCQKHHESEQDNNDQHHKDNQVMH